MRRTLKVLWFLITGFAVLGWTSLAVAAASGGDIHRGTVALAFGLLALRALVDFAEQIVTHQKEKLP